MENPNLKWMIWGYPHLMGWFIMENPIKIYKNGWFGGTPISGNLHIHVLCPIMTDGPPQPSTKREAKESQDAQVCLIMFETGWYLFFSGCCSEHVFFVSMIVFRCCPVDGQPCRKAYIHAAPNAGSAPMTAGGPGTSRDDVWPVWPWDTNCISLYILILCMLFHDIFWDILWFTSLVVLCFHLSDRSEWTDWGSEKGGPGHPFPGESSKAVAATKKRYDGMTRNHDNHVPMVSNGHIYPAWFLRLQFAKWKNPPCYSWVNPVFRWPCSSSQTLRHYQAGYHVLTIAHADHPNSEHGESSSSFNVDPQV